MQIEDLDALWHEPTEDEATGIEVREPQHPGATSREIEAVLDERRARATGAPLLVLPPK
jgi:hypothetical protein